MSDNRRYVLDANVFIQAHRMHYAFDICPGFWRALIRQNRARTLCSIDRVKSELDEEGDELSTWVNRDVPDDFFKRTSDKRVIDAFVELVNWVQSEEQFTAAAKATFAASADGWLVAFARVNGAVVVTHEEFEPLAKKRVKLPNICIEYNVLYCSTFDMIREVKEQFVLKTRRTRN